MPKTPAPLDPDKFILFTLYSLFIGATAALGVEAIKDWFEPGKEGHRLYLWVLLLISSVLLGTFFWIYDRSLRNLLAGRDALVSLNLSSSREVSPAKGLLFLVSRGKDEPYAKYAIAHHRERLTHLWLLYSTDAGSKANFDLLKAYCQEVAPTAVVCGREVGDMQSIEMAKAEVDYVRQQAREAGIGDEDFICDFTGMTKPVSVGVALACIRPEQRLEYMEPKGFLPDGRPDPRAGARPVEVKVGYDVELKR